MSSLVSDVAEMRTHKNRSANVIKLLSCLYYHADVGAKNYRNLCAVYYSKTPGFEVSENFHGTVVVLVGKMILLHHFNCWRCNMAIRLYLAVAFD